MRPWTAQGKQNPIASLLCGFIGGGTGLEGLLEGVLADGGAERIIIGTLAEVIRGILDDLTTAFLDGLSPGDAGLPRPGAPRPTRGPRANSALLTSREAPASCDEVTSDDLLGRLQCARQALDRVAPPQE
ncbi:MAG: hypothetical protein QM778_18955 [Myxococcales bacterium]